MEPSVHHHRNQEITTTDIAAPCQILYREGNVFERKWGLQRTHAPIYTKPTGAWVHKMSRPNHCDTTHDNHAHPFETWDLSDEIPTNNKQTRGISSSVVSKRHKRI